MQVAEASCLEAAGDRGGEIRQLPELEFAESLVAVDDCAAFGALDTVLSSLAQEAPAVVVNTIGPFTDTAPQVAGACPRGTNYVDVANELGAAFSVLDLHEQAGRLQPDLRERAGHEGRHRCRR